MKVLYVSGLEGLLVDYDKKIIKPYDDIDAYNISFNAEVWVKNIDELRKLYTTLKHSGFIIK